MKTWHFVSQTITSQSSFSMCTLMMESESRYVLACLIIGVKIFNTGYLNAIHPQLHRYICLSTLFKFINSTRPSQWHLHYCFHEVSWHLFWWNYSIHHHKLVSGSNGKHQHLLPLDSNPSNVGIWLVCGVWEGVWHAYMQSTWACSLGHVSVAQEIESWTLHLVGGVATNTRV